MKPEIILIVLLIIVTFDFLLERLLEYLNLRNLKEELPEEVKGIYDEAEYRKSILYTRENTRFGFVTSLFSFFLIFILLITGFFGWLDGLLRMVISQEIVLSLVFFAVIFIASDLINTPFQWYHTFVIEEKFGFNKMTVKTFISDKLKGYMLAFVIGGIILYILMSLINFFGKDFWIYFWVVISVFILFMNMFYTSLILPLFNKLTPLVDGLLKEKIEAYSKKVAFPLDNIYVMDGSKRSGKSNAFFSGIGKKKKIVLYDTLIENHTPEELVAILAHEVGHFKKRHIILGYVLSILQVGIMLYIMSLMIFSPALSIAMGGKTMAMHLNLLAFGILYSPVSHITGLFMNLFSRKNEYEADRWAGETFGPQPLMEALKKLSVKNLSNLTPHPWYVFINYSHPTLLQRLRALQS